MLIKFYCITNFKKIAPLVAKVKRELKHRNFSIIKL